MRVKAGAELVADTYHSLVQQHGSTAECCSSPCPVHVVDVMSGVQDSFVVRMYDVFAANPSSVIHELPLKLARKCLHVFGHDQAQGAVTALPG